MERSTVEDTTIKQDTVKKDTMPVECKAGEIREQAGTEHKAAEVSEKSITLSTKDVDHIAKAYLKLTSFVLLCPNGMNSTLWEEVADDCISMIKLLNFDYYKLQAEASDEAYELLKSSLDSEKETSDELHGDEREIKGFFKNYEDNRAMHKAPLVYLEAVWSYVDGKEEKIKRARKMKAIDQAFGGAFGR